MISRLKRSTARGGLVGVAALTAATLAGMGTANAATNPFPYADQYSINDASNGVGGIVFYGPTGGVVTGGSSSAPFASVVATASAIGTAPAPYNDPNGQYASILSIWTPTGTDPNSWSGNPFGSAQLQSDPTAKPSWNQADPEAGDTTTSLNSFVAAHPLQANGYYEIRLTTFDQNGGAATYYTEDIQINTSNNTFTVLDPAVTSPPAVTPEVPYSVLIPIAGLAAAGGTVVIRRRRNGVAAAI